MGRHKTALFVCLTISSFFTIGSLRLGLGEATHPGSGFLPFWVSVVVSILTMVELFRTVLGKTDIRDLGPLFQGRKIVKPLFVLCFLFAYFFLLDKLGFLACTALFLGGCLKVVAGKRWAVVIATSVITALGVYMLFVYWLLVQLPRGIWVTYLLR